MVNFIRFIKKRYAKTNHKKQVERGVIGVTKKYRRG